MCMTSTTRRISSVCKSKKTVLGRFFSFIMNKDSKYNRNITKLVMQQNDIVRFCISFMLMKIDAFIHKLPHFSESKDVFVNFSILIYDCASSSEICFKCVPVSCCSSAVDSFVF